MWCHRQFFLTVLAHVSSQYHQQFWSYENFPLLGINQKSGYWKYPRLSFAQYLESGAI